MVVFDTLTTFEGYWIIKLILLKILCSSPLREGVCELEEPGLGLSEEELCGTVLEMDSQGFANWLWCLNSGANPFSPLR